MKELFQSKKKEEEEENQAQNFYKKFQNQGPAYFGDLDEVDGKLLDFEMHAEDEGLFCCSVCCSYLYADTWCYCAEWQDAYSHLRTVLGLPVDEPIPPIPRPAKTTATITITDASSTEPSPPDTKRKASDGDVDMAPADGADDHAKRQRTDAPTQTGAGANAELSPQEAAMTAARATAAFISFLSPENLLPPKMPTREEMEQFLLDLRKKALVEEYFGDTLS